MLESGCIINVYSPCGCRHQVLLHPGFHQSPPALTPCPHSLLAVVVSVILHCPVDNRIVVLYCETCRGIVVVGERLRGFGVLEGNTVSFVRMREQLEGSVWGFGDNRGVPKAPLPGRICRWYSAQEIHFNAKLSAVSSPWMENEDLLIS